MQYCLEILIYLLKLLIQAKGQNFQQKKKTKSSKHLSTWKYLLQISQNIYPGTKKSWIRPFLSLIPSKLEWRLYESDYFIVNVNLPMFKKKKGRVASKQF